MEELNARISFEWNGKRYVLVSIYSRFYNKPSKGENFDLDLYQLTYDAFVFTDCDFAINRPVRQSGKTARIQTGSRTTAHD